MPKVAGIVDWGIETVTRTDLFGETWQDGLVGFGKHRGIYLSETSRHWLAWLYVVKEKDWPQALLQLIWYWGDRKSAGKDKTFDDLIDAMQQQ